MTVHKFFFLDDANRDSVCVYLDQDDFPDAHDVVEFVDSTGRTIQEAADGGWARGDGAGKDCVLGRIVQP